MKLLTLIALGATLATTAAFAEESYKPSVKVKRILQTTTTTSGDPIHYPSFTDPEVQSLIVEIPAGGETGWHTHPVPAYAYILAGTIEVDSEGGAQRIFKAGDSFAEMVDHRHNGRVVGDETVRILMIVTGQKGMPFSTRTAAPE
ncbi:cupin domain-containing protein [Kaistia defluvii]|uniref:Quercetin dioxygenase-like cupin family protein n=1 Tax=Kaistia defluvii TaxID=410841 RepID=A0ABV2QXB2_9HYPH